MIRLMGILTGSAIAVGFLIVTIGLPQFSAAPAEPLPRFEPVVEATPAPQPVVTALAESQAVTNDVDTLADELPTAPADEPPTAPDEEPPTAPDDELPAMAADVVAETQAALPPPVPEPPRTDEARWYSFWSPFRSEIAADGFVAELQRTTGLDYRVVRLKPGVYEVAFAYSDENDIQDKLTRISSATGLDLSGG